MALLHVLLCFADEKQPYVLSCIFYGRCKAFEWCHAKKKISIIKKTRVMKLSFLVVLSAIVLSGCVQNSSQKSITKSKTSQHVGGSCVRAHKGKPLTLGGPVA